MPQQLNYKNYSYHDEIQQDQSLLSLSAIQEQNIKVTKKLKLIRPGKTSGVYCYCLSLALRINPFAGHRLCMRRSYLHMT